MKAGNLNVAQMTEADVRTLAHDLQVHQIELEMQNEELIRIQGELMTAHDRYVALYDFAPIGYFTLDRKGTIQEVNLSGADLLARERGGLQNGSFFEFIDLEDRDAFFTYLRRIFQTGAPQDQVIRMVTAKADRFYAQLKSSFLPGETGDDNQCFLALSDITESKNAELVLKSVGEKIKSFAWSISHDLKNPALAVHGLTKRLHEGYREILGPKGGLYCDLILKGTADIVALVDKINEYISTGETALRFETVILMDLFQEIQDEFIGRFAKHRASLTFYGDPPAIKADRLALMRALRNLVDNALQYGGEDLSSIDLRYKDEGKHHVLCVQDNGIGIDQAETGRLFKQFSRLTSSRNIAGTGLGLSIVKKIAEQHQGRVWSEPLPGKGTLFCLSVAKELSSPQANDSTNT